MGLVKHKKLSKTQYDTLVNKDEDTLYAVNENGDFSESNMDSQAELYLGDKKLSPNIVDSTGQSTTSVMHQKAVTDAINLQADGFYGECNISPSTVAKEVTTLNSGFILKRGAKVSVKFLQGHTASTMTLNVDRTGAKSVYRDGLSPKSDMIKANNVYEFFYDGTYWRIVGVDTDTTYSIATTTSNGLMSSADKTKLDTLNYALAYDFRNGYLVKTSLPTDKNNMVLVNIIGHTYYSNKYPIQTIVQFYYDTGNSDITQLSATYIGTPIEEIKAFLYNGYVYIWFAQVNNYSTIKIKVANQYNSYRNYVDTITNSGVPEGATNIVTIVPKSSFVPSNTGYQRIGDQSTALGSYSRTGIRTGDTAYPYAYMTNVSPLPFTIVDDTLYGVSLAKGDSTTYTYNGNDYTVTNPSGSYAASVFLVQDSDGLLVKGTSYPMNICIIAKGAVTVGAGRILSAKNITGDVWEIIVNQQGNTIHSYTSPLILYLQKKISSTNYSGAYSVASGYSSVASGSYSVASGYSSVASGYSSVASGYSSVASGYYSVASGYSSVASDSSSVASGSSSVASGSYSVASGSYSVASGSYSVASGYSSVASGYYSVASGYSSVASGSYSVASGYYSVASGYSSVASGYSSVASGYYSVALNTRTNAKGQSQTVVGRFNADDNNAYFIVGNGTSDIDRSNAMTVSKNGIVTAKTFKGSLQGNADTATKVNNVLTIKKGSTTDTFDGSATKTIDITDLQNIGNLNNLQTSDKSNIVSAINEVNQKIDENKPTIVYYNVNDEGNDIKLVPNKRIIIRETISDNIIISAPNINFNNSDIYKCEIMFSTGRDIPTIETEFTNIKWDTTPTYQSNKIYLLSLEFMNFSNNDTPLIITLGSFKEYS